MPVLIPSGIYSTGRFKVDLSPIDQVIKQRAAEKKAANDAATKYFNSLREKVNTAGVRDIDRKDGDGYTGLDRKMTEWVNYGSYNIDKISQPGSPEQAEFLRKYNEIQNGIERSKLALKNQEEIGKARVEGKYDIDADDLHVLDHVSKSIYSKDFYKPDGTMYGWGDLPSAVKPFSINDQKALLEACIHGIKPKVNPAKNRTDESTHKIYLTEEYDNDDLKKIGNNALNGYYGSKEARKFYNDRLLDADWLKNVTEAYQSVYGTDKIVSTPEQAVQADIIAKAKNMRSESSIDDPAYIEEQKIKAENRAFKRSKELAAIQDGYAKAHIKLSHKLAAEGKPAPAPTYGQIYSPYIKNDPSVGGLRIDLTDINGNDQNYILGMSGMTPVQPLTDANGKKYFKVREDGSWEGKNGQKIDKSRILDQPNDDYKKRSSSIKPENAPGSDVAISQYPENIQRGIIAFSRKNNISLDEALRVLKQNRPDVFA